MSELFIEVTEAMPTIATILDGGELPDLDRGVSPPFSREAAQFAADGLVPRAKHLFEGLPHADTAVTLPDDVEAAAGRQTLSGPITLAGRRRSGVLLVTEQVFTFPNDLDFPGTRLDTYLFNLYTSMEKAVPILGATTGYDSEDNPGFNMLEGLLEVRGGLPREAMHARISEITVLFDAIRDMPR